MGDYVVATEPRLVNSFQVEITGAAVGHFIWADLYAPDRDDIPEGIPLAEGERTLSVYRVGYFSDHDTFEEPTQPVALTSATLAFNYGAMQSRDGRKIRVYHHDGSVNGTWDRVGSANYSSERPIISARTVPASSETWNIGYFAVTEGPKSGLVVHVK